MVNCKNMHRYYNPDNIVRNEPWYDSDRDVVKVCHGKYCANNGGPAIMEALHKYFKGTDLQIVACPEVGKCSNGVTVVVNTEPLYHQWVNTVAKNVEEEFEYQKKQGGPIERRKSIKVCHGPTCGQRDAKAIYKQMEEQYKDSDMHVEIAGCMGVCSKSNNLLVNGRLLTLQSRRTAPQAVQRLISMQKKEKEETKGPITTNEADTILGF